MKRTKFGWWWYFNKYNFVTFLISLPVILVLLFVLFTIFIWNPINIYTESVCLKYGYPESAVTFKLQKYCIRTIDQTEYVVPLDELEK